MKWNPPGSMSYHSWTSFREEFKEKAPVRYWFRHTLRSLVRRKIVVKYNNMKYWVRYRTYDKYHIVKTGLKPSYYEKDYILLHSNFNLLKEYVEVDLSWKEYTCSSEHLKDANWKRKHIPFYNLFTTYRRPDLGIQRLEWEATLDDPSLPLHERSPNQAVAAREILELYRWWVNDYPGYDSTIFSQKTSKLSSAVRQQYLHIETDMLVRLMKVRKHMWT